MEEMHKIDYYVKLTGSKLFDIAMYNTAKRLCAEFPGLEFDYEDKTSIHIFGELNDYWFKKYNNEMFESMGGM